MALKAGYKDTDAGVIPKDWTAAPLKGKVAMAHGFPFASEHFTSYGPYRLTTPGHFYEEGGFRDIGDKQKHYDGPVPSEYILRPGDLIVAMTEQADGLLGSAARIPQVDGYLHNQRLGRVKALSSSVELAFLFYLFNSPGYRAKVRETAAGTKVKHTSPEKLLEIAVQLPPIPEQRAIAAALSDVDALIGSLDRLIAKKRDLKQAAMQQLLTGRTRLPGFKGEWATKRVDAMGEVLAGKALAVHAPGRLRPYLRTKNVLDGRIAVDDVLEMPMTDAEFERFRIVHGDVLLNEGQSIELVGRCSMYRDELSLPCAMQNQLLRFRARPWTCATFAEQVFRRCQQNGVFAAISTQTTSVAHLGSSRFCRLQLLWPTDRAEQEAIAAVLSDMDAELTALEQRRDKTRLLKQGMMQELLTGRTRLV